MNVLYKYHFSFNSIQSAAIFLFNPARSLGFQRRRGHRSEGCSRCVRGLNLVYIANAAIFLFNPARSLGFQRRRGHRYTANDCLMCTVNVKDYLPHPSVLPYYTIEIAL